MNRGAWTPPEKVQKRQLEEAREFYACDQQLGVEDRKQLASFFRQRSTFFPVLAVPLTIGGAMLPSFLQKRKLLPENRSFRLLQTCLAFAGLFGGVQLSGALATAMHTSRLQSEAAVRAYKLLTQYPPQLGSTYFTMSAQDASLKFSDPTRTDWKKSPLFPLVLVMNERVVKAVRGRQRTEFEKFERQQQQYTDERLASKLNGEIPLAGNSWDRIIEQTNASEAQEHATEVPTDDFTDSEKKW